VADHLIFFTPMCASLGLTWPSAVTVTWLEHEAYHSCLSSAEAMNMWICTYIIAHSVVAWCLIKQLVSFTCTAG